MSSVTITLSTEDIAEADAAGTMRFMISKEMRLEPGNNGPRDDATSLEIDIQGARGEVAWRNYLAPVQWKRFLTADELRSGKSFADLEDWIDVKTRQQSHHSLIVQHKNPVDWAYPLACAALHPHYQLIGWCWGHEAKQAKYWWDPKGDRPAYFVPGYDPILRPPATLLAEVRRRRVPARVGYDKDGHFFHYCDCGKWGAFGYGASLRKGMLGEWFCQEHRPGPPVPPPPRPPQPPPPPPAQGDLFAE